MNEAFLEIKGITKEFPGVKALEDVSLEIDKGEALALIGANGAGKSTLMNILGGILTRSGGKIKIGGNPVNFRTPHEATESGIAFVHQELALLPTLTVVENMYIDHFPTIFFGVINYREARQECAVVLQRLQCSFKPATRVETLGAGDRQMVEIARALLGKPKLVIFDEPTSSLSNREKQKLFEVIRGLKRDGVTIIYITHLLDEVFTVCDRAVVLRNGRSVGEGMIRDLTENDIIKMIIGDKNIQGYFKHRATKPREESAIRVDGLTRLGVLDNVSFELKVGEVVGLWGLLGSGRTELARSMVGLDPIDSGRIEMRIDEEMRAVSPKRAGKQIGMVSENRREDGLLLTMSVKTNMSLANLKALMSKVWPFIDNNLETRTAQDYVDRLSIKIAGLEQPVETLSGGNQQKVVVSRWLQRNPRIYIMDEPTRGLDVGAKAEIHQIIGRLADEGATLLVISSDIDEIISLSDRFLVMQRGRIVADLPAGATKEELMTAAAGTL